MQKSVFGGERGIRTPVPSFLDHPISSRRRYDRFGISPFILQKRRIIAHAVLLFFLFFLISCDNKELNSDSRTAPFGREDPLIVLMRPDILSYVQDSEGNISGFDADFIKAFADSIKHPIHYLVVGHDHMEDFLKDGEYHIAASWLSPTFNTPKEIVSESVFLTQDILLMNNQSPPVANINDLKDQTIYVMAGSRQAQTARRLAQNLPIKVVEFMRGDLLDLADLLAENKISYVIIDEKMRAIIEQYLPQLKTGILLSEAAPIVWLFHPHTPAAIKNAFNEFLKESLNNGFLKQLEERYLGHVHRLNALDVRRFVEQVEKTLPRYREMFVEAAEKYNLDWKLLAALSYQESLWDPRATSYTQVRGMMMLTEATAKLMGISDRLDPKQSIMAGAKYLNMIKSQVPEEVMEPDRTWFALASYNIGPGALAAGRRLAEIEKADPNTWMSLKNILPLLARPAYAQKANTVRARGGEAVILVENVRAFLDLLEREEGKSTHKAWDENLLEQVEKTENIAQEIAKIKETEMQRERFLKEKEKYQQRRKTLQKEINNFLLP